MFDGCIIKWNIINQFWTYIFLILPKSIQRRFFHIFGKWHHAKDSWRYILFIKNMSHKEYHTKENWLIYMDSKNHRIPCFHSGDIAKCVTVPPNPGWTIYAPHFSILQAVPKMHCLCANAVVHPSVQHCPCYMAWCRHCHLWMHPCEEKKDGCKDFLTLPHTY